MSLTTTHTDRKVALEELAKRIRESRQTLESSIRTLLDARAKLTAKVEAVATHLQDIDAAAAAAPGDVALAGLAAEKRLILDELNAQKTMLDNGETVLRSDPQWAVLIDRLQGVQTTEVA